jgi:hypothetical protein
MRRQPTVRDHLLALGETPEWVISLGDAIQEITACSTAIAASRARDLSRSHVCQGLTSFTSGWLELESAEMNDLSPMQLETLRLVIEAITNKLRQRVDGADMHSQDEEAT